MKWLEPSNQETNPHSLSVGARSRGLFKIGASLNPLLSPARPLEQLEIDGSYGEGGGQILRTAVAFSIILRRPIRVTKIRAGRGVPGLRTQHAATLRLLRDISSGKLDGAEVGSTEISFEPGTVESASLRIDMKTAASITLALQAVIPAVSLSGSTMELEVVGGTDVPWSPTFDYLAFVVKDCFDRVGIRFHAAALRRGYYPAGGGVVKARIEKAEMVSPLDMVERGGEPSASIYSRCGSLPKEVAERQASSATKSLRGAGIRVERTVVTREESQSPGSSILVCASGHGFVFGSDSLGARGKRAESVGLEASGRFLEVALGPPCVDSNLADMVAPLLMLAPRPSRLLIPGATGHLTTSLHVARLFTGGAYTLERREGCDLLTVFPRGTGQTDAR
jgi:RNA 3'-phosphate cyclase